MRGRVNPGYVTWARRRDPFLCRYRPFPSRGRPELSSAPGSFFGLGTGLGGRSRGRRLLDPFRWNVAKGQSLGIAKQTGLRMARLPQADDHSRRGREVHPVIEPIDDVQIEFSEIQSGPEVSLARVHEHAAGLPVHQKEVKVVRPQEEFGAADRGKASALGRSLSSGARRYWGRSHSDCLRC